MVWLVPLHIVMGICNILFCVYLKWLPSFLNTSTVSCGNVTKCLSMSWVIFKPPGIQGRKWKQCEVSFSHIPENYFIRGTSANLTERMFLIVLSPKDYYEWFSKDGALDQNPTQPKPKQQAPPPPPITKNQPGLVVSVESGGCFITIGLFPPWENQRMAFEFIWWSSSVFVSTGLSEKPMEWWQTEPGLDSFVAFFSVSPWVYF